MAANHETLTIDGLIYELMTGIAKQEGKYQTMGGWSGNREYVLSLTREVIDALSGPKRAEMMNLRQSPK